MLYWVLRVLGVFALRQYFRQINIKGQAPDRKGAEIIVGNHFNGILDPLLVGATVPYKCWFVGKSTVFLFWRPFKWFSLNFLQSIPVYRSKDGNDTKKNTESFVATTKALGRGGKLVIFPPETNEDKRLVHRFKTGAVRMAFDAEVANDWSLNLLLRPCGIDYSSFGEYRSSVTVNYGEPIRLIEWRDHYLKDPYATVQLLTKLLHQRVRDLTAEISDQKDAAIIEKISRFFETRYPDDNARIATIAKNVAVVAKKDPHTMQRVSGAVDHYLRLADTLGIRPGEEAHASLSSWAMLKELILLPVTVVGAFLHLPPFLLTAAITSRMVNEKALDPYYRGTVRFLSGFLLFLLWYVIVSLFLILTCGISPVSALLLLGCIGSGIVANRHASGWRLLLLSFSPKTRTRVQTIGDKLRSDLEELREV